jgi:two-component system, sensor histidine kinase
MKAETDELKELRELVVNQNLFLAATAHDLRQPLHAIGLFLSAINSELEVATDIADARLRIGVILKRLDRSMHGVDDEIQRLLDWSRLQSGAILPNRKEFALRRSRSHAVCVFGSRSGAMWLSTLMRRCSLKF